jgi:hypothetical protein
MFEGDVSFPGGIIAFFSYYMPLPTEGSVVRPHLDRGDRRQQPEVDTSLSLMVMVVRERVSNPE